MLGPSSSSSRMRVINHNWSATKQHLHPSSAECSRDKPPFSFVKWLDSTMWDFVWVSPQGHRSVSVSRHFLLQAPQCRCSVLNRFSRDHCCRGRSKPGCRIVGSLSGSNGGLRISDWIGQLSCLSVAAFLRRAGSSMLESTGSHGRGVERRVPETRRTVEFNCTSTWLVWAERDHTRVQFSAAE